MLKPSVRLRVLICAALLLLAPRAARAAGVTLAWDANPETDVIGYVVHYGTRSGVYDRMVDVGNRTSFTLDVTTPGTATYYFAVAAYSPDGMSDLSAEVFETVTGAPASNPVIQVDYPFAAQVLPPDMVLSGWAADLGAAAGTGVDAIHVYAYPDTATGRPGFFVGVASYGAPRGDVAAVFGAQFLNAGYSLPISGLAPGLYDFAVCAHSTVAGSFSVSRLVRIRVFSATTAPPPSGGQLSIDAPAANSVVRGALTIAGWALDLRASIGTGVDRVDLWAYPQPGSGTMPVFLGTAAYGGARGDVGGAFGARFTPSGFNLSGVRLPAGVYDLAVFARSTVSGGYDRQRVTRVTVQPPVVVAIDTPTPSATVPGSFYIAGWAVDLRATSDSGVDTLHVWGYPAPGSGASPAFLGVATQGVPRGDVGSAYGSRYATSGYFLAVSGLAPGTYDLVVFARSSVSGLFESAGVVRVTVQ